MREVILSVTGVGVSDPIVMDQYISPFNVGFGVVVDGTVTYTVQHSFNDPFATQEYDPVVVTWFNHETVAAQSTNQDGNYAFPVRMIRLNVTAGDGTATLQLAQAGI